MAQGSSYHFGPTVMYNKIICFLGHGPFSHLWEVFVRKANPKSDWHHEDSSIKMLDYLIKDNNLMPLLKKLGGLDEQDILFIKELIGGPMDPLTGSVCGIY
jgi:hypothetical protein